MIRQIVNVEEVSKEIFALPWSIYPYANFLKYGTSKECFTLYVSGDCFFTKYHDSVQVCSKTINGNDAKEIAAFIVNNNIRMVSGSTDCMSAIFPLINKGRIEHGLIFSLKPFAPLNTHKVEYAKTREEFTQIAKLVCKANSNNKGYYGLEQYFDQIYSRFSEGYCRNWIYKFDNKIVGHVATYAETPLYGVIGGLAVDDNYRRQGIAKRLLSSSIDALIKEKKEVFAFCYKENLVEFYNSISFNSYPTSKIIIG